MAFFEREDYINKAQHGYRKRRSVCSAVNDAINTIIEAWDRHEDVLMSCYYLSKAFNTVNVEVLLDKLHCYYGIRENVHKLAENYLTNRKQYVAYNGSDSNPRSSNLTGIDCGVSQGSVLGPILFLIYVNDLPCSVSADCTGLYADDTFLVK